MDEITKLQRNIDAQRANACAQADYGNWAPTRRINEMQARLDKLLRERWVEDRQRAINVASCPV